MKREIYEPYTASLGDAERVVAPYLKDQQLETIRLWGQQVIPTFR